VALLDLLRQGKAPALNKVEAGDVIDEASGRRERLDRASQEEIAADARRSLETMIRLTDAAGG
jgi:quinolinate synthase